MTGEAIRISVPSASADARPIDVHTTGTIQIGDRTVRRLGFGAMRISGARDAHGVRDRDEARRLVRAVVERGVTFIDTANIYGYGQSEEIIAEALHPYPAELLVTTKAGFEPGKVLPGMTSLPPLGRPEHIREECEKSLRRLRVDCIELYQVHVPDPSVPYEETVGAFVELQQEGKVRHIGVSNVTVDQLAVARSLCEVVSVQNRYNPTVRGSDDVLAICERDGIAFIPHSPGIFGATAAAEVLDSIAGAHGVSANQISIAWLLDKSTVMVPIPGTSQVAHAMENVDAAFVRLTRDERSRIEAAGSQRVAT